MYLYFLNKPLQYIGIKNYKLFTNIYMYNYMYKYIHVQLHVQIYTCTITCTNIYMYNYMYKCKTVKNICNNLKIIRKTLSFTENIYTCIVIYIICVWDTTQPIYFIDFSWLICSTYIL
jgi:hypothetical protein